MLRIVFTAFFTSFARLFGAIFCIAQYRSHGVLLCSCCTQAVDDHIISFISRGIANSSTHLHQSHQRCISCRVVLTSCLLRLVESLVLVSFMRISTLNPWFRIGHITGVLHTVALLPANAKLAATLLHSTDLLTELIPCIGSDISLNVALCNLLYVLGFLTRLSVEGGARIRVTVVEGASIDQEYYFNCNWSAGSLLSAVTLSSLK